MSTTVVEFENKDIHIEMSGQGPMGPRGYQGETGPQGPQGPQGEPGPAGISEWGEIQGNISDQTDLQDALDAKADVGDSYTKDEEDTLLDGKANVGASYTKSEDDDLLAQKADADSVYTKTETDDLLADKADTDDVYSKTEVNTLLSGKADSDTVYTKTETDTLLGAKADVGDSYTKAEEDTLLNAKANSADVYTKTETDTLLADKADADDVYTKDDVDDALADKADSADVYTKEETDTILLDKAPVILNSASGSIASFSDGSAAPVTALSVSIEPVQDLHGYDNPWPAGGGKNLLNVTATTQTLNGVTFTVNRDSSGNLIDITVNGTATEACIFNLGTYSLSAGTYTLNGCPSGGSTTTYYMDWRTDDGYQRVDIGSGNTISTEGQTKKISRIIVASGITLSNAVFKPMIRLASVTDDTYAPYSNICPISGWTSANIERSGVNLFDKTATNTENGYVDGKWLNVNGGLNTDSANAVSEYIQIVGNKSYTLTGAVGTNVSLVFYDSNKSVISGERYGGQNPKTVTAPINAEFLRFSITKSLLDTTQLEVGNSATAYKPFVANTKVTIDLDGTRYGGVLDVLTGTMTVTRMLIDLGNLTWSQEASGAYRFYTPLAVSNLKGPATSSGIPNAICSALRVGSNNQTYGHAYDNLISWSSSAYLYVYASQYSDAATFKTAMSGQKLCAEMVTPLTVPLTLAQMQTLLGENHIFADTGDTSVEYRADSKLYIDQKIAESQRATRSLIAGIETEMVATKNYTVGDLLIVWDTLYTVTANIGSGSAITVGTNVTATTVAEQLIALANA